VPLNQTLQDQIGNLRMALSDLQIQVSDLASHRKLPVICKNGEEPVIGPH